MRQLDNVANWLVLVERRQELLNQQFQLIKKSDAVIYIQNTKHKESEDIGLSLKLLAKDYQREIFPWWSFKKKFKAGTYFKIPAHGSAIYVGKAKRTFSSRLDCIHARRTIYQILMDCASRDRKNLVVYMPKDRTDRCFLTETLRQTALHFDAGFVFHYL